MVRFKHPYFLLFACTFQTQLLNDLSYQSLPTIYYFLVPYVPRQKFCHGGGWQLHSTRVKLAIKACQSRPPKAILQTFFPVSMTPFRSKILLFEILKKFVLLQLCQMKVIPILSKPHVNEVFLKEQKLPINCYQPLDFWYTSLKGLGLSIL